MKTTLWILLITAFSTIKLFGQTSNSKLKISHLTGDFYVCTTYKIVNGILFPSNNMYVVTDSGVVMIDTPWDMEQTIPLVDSIWQKHNRNVVACIVTHRHNDRTAGLDILRSRNIKTYSSKQTWLMKLNEEQGEKRTEFYFENDTVFLFGNHTLETYHPGKGHTKDNIVVWFEKDHVLFGGCFVKSIEATDLGYLGEAYVDEWPVSVKNVINKFSPEYVIPGHQSWESTEALNHTMLLLDQYQSTKTHKNEP